MNARLAVAGAASWFWTRKSDPSDWLSPVVVKEIRQGLRTRTFLLASLGLQALLLCALTQQMVESQKPPGLLSATGEQWFWTVIVVIMAVVLPARGFVAISVERGEDTLELMQLTDLSAWRIVVGKWLALFVQNLLLFSAVLPYIIVRYFLGATEVVQEVLWLAVLAQISGVLTAAAIAVSAFQNWLIRGLLAGLFSIAFISGAASFADSTTGAGEIPISFLLWIFGYGTIFMQVFFEMAASRIESEQQMYARRKQILIVSLILGGVVFGVLGVNPISLVIPFVIALIGLGIATAHQTPLHESKLYPVASPAEAAETKGDPPKNGEAEKANAAPPPLPPEA